MLRMHSRFNVHPHRDQLARSIRRDLQHLHGITQVEMKYLFSRHAMHLRKRLWREQVVNRGGQRTTALRTRELLGRAIRLAKESAFNR